VTAPANATVALIVRGVITLALLVFALFHGDGEVTVLIIGTIAGYWLREGEGQALRRRREGRRGDGTGSGRGTGSRPDRPPLIEPSGHTYSPTDDA